jgi:hypothetical protein
MLPVNLALVSQSRQTNPADVSHVAAALQKQATRDLAPVWGISATVVAFPSLRNVPVGYWPVVVVDRIDQPGAAGYHQDNHGRPYALVLYSASWSLTASHEVLEMLVDPFGHRTAAGRSPKAGQGQVEYLVEACDPCEGQAFAYTIDGVLVSDFITPRYYDPRKTSGAHYSFTGAVKAPRTILEDGYISWWDPQSNHVWQERWFGTPKPTIVDLGEGSFDQSRESLREFVDRETPHAILDDGLPEDDATLADAREGWQGAAASSDALGAILEAEVSRHTGR